MRTRHRDPEDRGCPPRPTRGVSRAAPKKARRRARTEGQCASAWAGRPRPRLPASDKRVRRAAVRVNEVMNEHKALCSPSGTENLSAWYRCGRSWFAVYGTSAQAGEREARCPDCREAVRPAGRGVSILSPGIWRAREGRAPGLLATRPTEISHCLRLILTRKAAGTVTSSPPPSAEYLDPGY